MNLNYECLSLKKKRKEKACVIIVSYGVLEVRLISISEDLYTSKKVLKTVFWRVMMSSVNSVQYMMNAQPGTLSPSLSISLGDGEDFVIGLMISFKSSTYSRRVLDLPDKYCSCKFIHRCILCSHKSSCCFKNHSWEDWMVCNNNIETECI